ncbi:hypothetical protein GCM10027294_42200 [Marinactinospora endophytica]
MSQVPRRGRGAAPGPPLEPRLPTPLTPRSAAVLAASQRPDVHDVAGPQAGGPPVLPAKRRQRPPARPAPAARGGKPPGPG